MENRLIKLQEFRQVLANYHISEHGKKILAETKLALLIGPSASGRDTIIQKLLKTDEYYYIVSDTTRKPRVNNQIPEQNGVEYWFRSEAEFLADLKASKLLEAEIIHEQHASGISIRELEKAHKAGKIAITNVDLNIKKIVAAKPDTMAIVVLPPSFEEWQRRVAGRGFLEASEYRRRMQTACTIFKETLTHSSFLYVINDNIEHAALEIDQIVNHGGVNNTELQARARTLAVQLLHQTQASLQNS